MLDLVNIRKTYEVGDQKVEALKGINLSFRKSEFVSILGPSGCGKTTLLNIIGGLDRYTEGDLKIDHITTKSYKDKDWDSYRNHRIGFVFQSYNLISHATVLSNVELSLTLSGMGRKERLEKAKQALKDVGLEDQLYKKPNQLSGGQMQRVAIARALVNDPSIILADEPTGALDSQTSIQIMEILKKIARDRLIIMVTHNPNLANTYSDRVIHLLDGNVTSDSNPFVDHVEKATIEEKANKTAMSYLTALKLSATNLRTKLVRTLIIALAGSIGIIGVGLVLSLYNGVNTYLSDVQMSTLSSYPITVSETYIDYESVLNSGRTQYEDSEFLFPYDSPVKKNIITQDYIHYLEQGDLNIRYEYFTDPTFVLNIDQTYMPTNIEGLSTMIRSSSYDKDFFSEHFDVFGSLPADDSYEKEGVFEMLLVVNKANQIPKQMAQLLGLDFSGKLPFSDIIYNPSEPSAFEVKLIPNSIYYKKTNSSEGSISYREPFITEYQGLFDDTLSKEIRIVGIAKPKKDSLISERTAFIYFDELMDFFLEDARNSTLIADQKTQEQPVLSGLEKNEVFKKVASLSYDDTLNTYWTIPEVISIYPKNFEDKTQVRTYLDAYNETMTNEDDKIYYTDQAQVMISVVEQMIDVMTYVLVAFAAISLFVSSIMIGIITYVSVVERTKEIGVLRSLGARKKDIRRVFNAETLIIGFTAGLIGVLVTIILNPLLSSILYQQAQIKNLASLSVIHGVALIVISMALTLIAGVIPASIASKKDPVVALRTE